MSERSARSDAGAEADELSMTGKEWEERRSRVYK